MLQINPHFWGSFPGIGAKHLQKTHNFGISSYAQRNPTKVCTMKYNKAWLFLPQEILVLCEDHLFSFIGMNVTIYNFQIHEIIALPLMCSRQYTQHFKILWKIMDCILGTIYIGLCISIFIGNCGSQVVKESGMGSCT